MKKLIALLLAALMLFALAGCGAGDTASTGDAEEARTFIMGIDPEYPPFSSMADDGSYVGFDVEVCQAVCEKLGWEFKVFGVNWDEKLIQLDAKECDCIWSGMTILDSMKKEGYVISEPYFDNEQVLVVKADSGYKASGDLKDKLVAVQLGTSGEKLLEEDLKKLADSFKKVVSCDSFPKCFTELEYGNVDAVFVDKPVAENFVSKNEGYSVIDEDFGAEQYGIAFRNGDDELCKKVEGAIDELIKDGTYENIADKYPEIKNNLILLNK